MTVPQKRISKHSEIYRKVLTDIKTGTYQPGDRLPTEEEYVRQFGVSRPTVARALRDLENEELIERKAGSGTYVREPEAASVSGEQLGLIIPDFQMTGIFEPISLELAMLARRSGYSLHIGGSAEPLQSQEAVLDYAVKLCKQYIKEKVAGVIFTPFELVKHKEEDSLEVIQLLVKAEIPVVLLDRDLVPFPNRSGFDLVSIDNAAGGFMAADHLIRLGCRRLVFIARENSATSVRARLVGVKEAMAFHEIEPQSGWIQIHDPECPNFAASLPILSKSDAVVCANDITAAHLLRFLDSNNIRVPRDLRVTGFDNAEFAPLLGSALTTLEQPCREVAVAAFETLLDRIRRPGRPARSVYVSPKLIIRESCGIHLPKSNRRG
ncbi:MAG: GntR family transcriptional regulator [Chthoniobacteraceae bacterium]